MATWYDVAPDCRECGSMLTPEEATECLCMGCADNARLPCGCSVNGHKCLRILGGCGNCVEHCTCPREEIPTCSFRLPVGPNKFFED